MRCIVRNEIVQNDLHTRKSFLAASSITSCDRGLVKCAKFWPSDDECLARSGTHRDDAIRDDVSKSTCLSSTKQRRKHRAREACALDFVRQYDINADSELLCTDRRCLGDLMSAGATPRDEAMMREDCSMRMRIQTSAWRALLMIIPLTR